MGPKSQSGVSANYGQTEEELDMELMKIALKEENKDNGLGFFNSWFYF